MPGKTAIKSSSKVPQVNFFEPTPKTEALRLLFIAHKIITGQYQHFYWLVLPDLVIGQPPHIIYFPDFPYLEIDNFWKRSATDVQQTTPPQAKKDLLNDVSNLLKKDWDQDLHQEISKKIEDSFRKVEKSFWQDFFRVFPGFLGELKTINIYPTRYGTTKSFSVLKNKTINIYVRADQPVSTIIEGIVSGLTRKTQVKQNFTWEETEVAKDVVLLTTILSKYCPNYVSTITSIRFNQKASLKKKSDEYLAKLGLKRDDFWRIVRGENDGESSIFYKNKKIKDLTKKERITLRFLVKNKDRVVSIDELGSIVYPDSSKFSLWGLAKIIERLRKKLYANSLPEHLIQVHRKRGYSIFSIPRLKEVDENSF